MRHAPLAFALLVLAAACSGGNGGGTSTAPPPPPPPPPPVAQAGAVSGASPFPATCGAGEGTAFVGAEVEPSIAVNPRDEGNLIAVWQQDRWSNGAARGLLSAASFDGGVTWTASAAPFSQCAGGHAGNGGDFLRATDPWVAFGPDGVAYQSALVLSGGSFTAGSSNAMRVSRSADGGRSWSTPATLILDGGEFFNDKETVTADPTDARFAYVVWDRLQRGGHGPAWLARTADGGLTWEPARMIYDPGAGAQTVGNLVRVLRGGTLVNVFMELRPANGNTAGAVRVVRSGDRGLTWSAPITVSNAQPLGARDPTTGLAIRDGSILPQMAAGPDGALHVVWQDGRFTGGRDGIAYARSTDGGLTWSAPVRANADPAIVAFTPQVHVAADGTVAVTYYDLGPNTNDPDTLLTDFRVARTADGGATWSHARVAGPFDLASAPLASGAPFLGDYTGLASTGATFLALHARTTGNPASRTDIFLARVAPGLPGEAAPHAQAKGLVERGDEFRRRVSDHLARAAASRLP